VFLAATYPDVVALTVVLVSPYWHRIAANEDMRKLFYAEAGWRSRRDRNYWPKRNDPLHHWVEDLVAQRSDYHDHPAHWPNSLSPKGTWRLS
jgi:hypothetical protein